MNIFGKPSSDYIRFSRLFLVLIAVTGLVRLALSLGGVPNSTVKWFSMTGLMWIAVVYYLNFDGNTRDAMTFYHRCLGGELLMAPFSEIPSA